MFGMHENTAVRPSPVKRARDYLDWNGCVSMNPFIGSMNREQLLESLKDFSTNIALAGKELQKVTGVPFKEDDAVLKAHDLVQIFIVSNLDRHSPEKRLRTMFDKAVMDADFSLRDLEKSDGNADLAKTAMRNLEKLITVVKAAPTMYGATPVERQADFVFKM